MSSITLTPRAVPLVLATEWNVSTTTGSGITGVELSVYRIVNTPKDGPPPWYRVEYAVRRTFASHDEADTFCLAEGYLKPYVHKSL